jgi:hypothetical protein
MVPVCVYPTLVTALAWASPLWRAYQDPMPSFQVLSLPVWTILLAQAPVL